MNKKEGQRYLIVATLIIVVVALVAFWFLYQPSNYLEFSSLDVGQGDAELIKTPNGQIILVDGGADNKVVRRLGEELPFWQKKIDLVVLTHPHDDHFIGLIDVFKRYQVTSLLITGVEYFSPGYKEFISIVQRTKTKIFIYNGLNKFVVNGLNIESLYPLVNVANRKYDNLNNSSIILRLSYYDINFLLMGDAEVLVEQELLATKANLFAQVIKLGHHGSDTSSSEEFLKKVEPKVALISVGKDNEYGHPSQRILKRLERLNIKYYLTQDSGTVHLKTNGQWLENDDACLIANCSL